MRRWAVLLAALLALGAAVPAVDARPKLTKKQQRCLKAAKKKHTKAKRRAAKKRCLRKRRKPTASPSPAPTAAAPGAPTRPGGPAPSDPGPAPDDHGPTLPDDPSGGGRSVQVQSGEWWLRLSRASVLAGDVRVEFDNSRGEDAHDLKLLRGDTVYSFDEQPSGAITARTLHLTAGTWELFCALPDHAENGMEATLSVTAG
jgi:plastocyanin